MNKFLFNCEKGEDKKLFNDFQTNFVSKIECEDNFTIKVGSNFYHKEAVLEEIDEIGGYVQREWFLFQSIALYDNVLSYEEIIKARDTINAYFSLVRESLQICNCPVRKESYKKKLKEILKNFANCVIPLDKIKGNFVIKLSSWKNNDVHSPVYQYFHTYLEVEYYLLFLSYIIGETQGDDNDILEKIMRNLIHLSKVNYDRQFSKIFVCSCVKNFWLLIQIFLEKTNLDNECFWKLFNKSLSNEVPIFSICLLTEIAGLQLIEQDFQYKGNSSTRIRPNYDLLQNKLNSVLINADSEVLLKLFETLTPLLNNYWLKDARVEVYQIIWDFYSKRLNISKKNYSKYSATDFKNTLNNIIFETENCKEDFEKFLSIFISHLRAHPNHWGKMKGRIYTQLGPQKIKDLNHVGISHVLLLYFTLSTLNYEELFKKIIAVFEGQSQEKKQEVLTWNLFISFIIMQLERNLSVEKTATVLLSWIQDVSLDHKNFHLIKLFISNYIHILNANSNMQLHQWLFLHSWLTKYISSCYHSDMSATFDVLLRVIEKVENPDYWSYWSTSFKTYVYPVLKQATHTYNAPGNIGKIAGKMCLVTPYLYTDIFSYFTNENIPPKIGYNFLEVVLAEYPSNCILNSQQELSVIQMWFKICLQMSDCTSLTNIVTKLDYFPNNLKMHLNSSQDPVKALVEYLGSDLQTHQKSNSIRKLCEMTFGTCDKWLKQYIGHPDNEASVLKIYVNISLAFLHCGPVLYHRSSHSSPLTKLIECLLLPSEVLIGKTPHEYILNSVKATWNTFYESLVLLKDDSDVFIERTLRDLITKYMTHFSTTDSPIIKSLQNDFVAEVILDKISSSYFKHPVKESDNNLIKVIKVLSDSVQCTTSVNLLRLVVTKTLCALFELVIFHPQRNLAINLIKVICSSPLYNQVKEEFASCITSITERHLVFNATNYFQLMFILAKFVPDDIKKLYGKITEQVAHVERLRGVGFDTNLRSQLEKLDKLIVKEM